jgi:mono/diheme cytochrome c family protein
MKWLEASILFAALAVVFALGAPTAAAQETPSATEPDGQALYDQQCKKCHGPAGGAPSAAMMKLMENLGSVTDPAFLAATPDDSLISVIEQGRGKMKPFSGEMAEEGHRLTREEILAIVKFLRTFEAAAPAPGPEVPEGGEKPTEVPGS